jgi:hypothetical protein
MEGTESPAPEGESSPRYISVDPSSSFSSRDVKLMKGTDGQVVFDCMERVGRDVSKSEGGWTPGACRLKQVPATVV